MYIISFFLVFSYVSYVVIYIDYKILILVLFKLGREELIKYKL